LGCTRNDIIGLTRGSWREAGVPRTGSHIDCGGPRPEWRGVGSRWWWGPLRGLVGAVRNAHSDSTAGSR